MVGSADFLFKIHNPNQTTTFMVKIWICSENKKMSESIDRFELDGIIWIYEPLNTQYSKVYVIIKETKNVKTWYAGFGGWVCGFGWLSLRVCFSKFRNPNHTTMCYGLVRIWPENEKMSKPNRSIWVGLWVGSNLWIIAEHPIFNDKCYRQRNIKC